LSHSERVYSVVTAGVYVLARGLFPFQAGPDRSGQVLGVVRLGGHREEGETGWECASREAWEEASIRVSPVAPPATYWLDYSESDRLSPGPWEEEGIAPILVSRRADGGITPIYLATSTDSPVPAAETKALLLLRPEEIRRMATTSITLRQYLEAGGQAVSKAELPLDFILQPFPHLRLLHVLLQMHPELARLAPPARHV
jgi:8-oxo-dGTP pyrophosphatase MutT (NUDIX family)